MKVFSCYGSSYQSVILLITLVLVLVTSTIIVVEDAKACFRRVLAGKRVARGFVKRALVCERLEDCQYECGDEKHFVCEGFNYRLDPSGRGKGECELLDLPLSRLDIGRDLYPDPDYDYYERDRNAGCKRRHRPGGYLPPLSNLGGGSASDGYYHQQSDRDYNADDYYYDRNRRPGSISGWKDRWPPEDELTYGNRRPDFDRRRRPADYDADERFKPDYGDRRRRPDYFDRDDYRGDGGNNRRGDLSYYSHHSQHQKYESSHKFHQEIYDNRGSYPNPVRGGGHHYLPPNPTNRPLYQHPPPPPPAAPYDDKSYEPYLRPSNRPPPPPVSNPPYDQRVIIKYYTDPNDANDYWGLNEPNKLGAYGGSYGHSNRNRYGAITQHHQNNHYLPAKVGGTKDWGQYGGSYGNGGHNQEVQLDDRYDKGHGQNFNYWGFNKYEDTKKHHQYQQFGYYNNDHRHHQSNFYGDLPPLGIEPDVTNNYLLPPIKRPIIINPGGSSGSSSYGHQHHINNNGFDTTNKNYYNSLLPVEPRFPPYNFLKDECSLRTATGFRLHKGIVKKFYAVPNIYECELLCFKERDFKCTSYAFRYTITLTAPTDNCYLSNRNYKALDFYTDLQPDRDFDIYTMNNQNKCEQPVVQGKDNSDCFWRVRSGQRLHHKVVRDSLTVKSIVDCQIECLRCTRFTCRAFSYRYGSAVFGGAIDNCQLTDWPFFELEPARDFVPEISYEVYDRGSFGHGCEPDHFGIRGRQGSGKPMMHGHQADQLCYIGFGSPVRLLPQATKKSLWVATELDCKVECSKLRDGTLFQCMSFSYSTTLKSHKPNCFLSDILQRDLLPKIDYIHDPDSWLFAWDNFNPECIAIISKEPSTSIIDDNNRIDGLVSGRFDDRQRNHEFSNNALDTWKVYSVSGWPCRRGSLCHENREAGFWFCELEGGDPNTWDYCCRPDHQCGYSEGFPYQWCYVGPAKTQWRKCSDRYYPYIHNLIDRIDYNQQTTKPYRPASSNHWRPGNYRPGIRPDRPPAPPTDGPPRPSLDEYETQFDNQFLDPPRPGGFGQARHWPVSYLHKIMPANDSSSNNDPQERGGRDPLANPKFAAIQSLIDVIKSNDLKNVQYQITNESNKEDDILFVRIPLPTNFTQQQTGNKNSNGKLLVDDSSASSSSNNGSSILGRNDDGLMRSQKSLDMTTLDDFQNSRADEELDGVGSHRIYTQSANPQFNSRGHSFVTKMNVTTAHGRRGRIEKTFI